jgi:hypothetical protein
MLLLLQMKIKLNRMEWNELYCLPLLYKLNVLAQQKIIFSSLTTNISFAATTDANQGINYFLI